MQADPLVGRIVRIAAVICAVTTAAAWLLAGPRMAAGVLGGGLLIGISFYTLGGGVAALMTSAAGGQVPRRTMGGSLIRLVLRYALLGFLAYVMIARLRLHPIGLLVGVTSVVAAAFFEAVRLLAKNR